jgi:signal transduction histidine kinase/DNA-binding response OmpR family regulator
VSSATALKHEAGPIAHILHLEDSAIDGALVRDFLEADGVSVRIRRVWTRDDFADALAGREFDLILADHQLPSFDGDAALEMARDLAPEIPFIFVSGTLGEDVAVESLRRGATDYVVKQRMDRLPAVVARALAEQREREQRRETEVALAQSERDLQIALRAGRFGTWSLDLKAKKLVTSELCRQIYGRAANADFSYGDWLRSIHPHDKEQVLAAIARCIETGEDYDFEYRILTPSQAVRWVAVRGQPVYDADGVAAQMVGVALEIDQRKREEIRRSAINALEATFRSLDDPADIAFAAAEMLGRTLGVSRAGYGVIDPVAETITIERDWNDDGIKSLAGVLHFRDYGSYIEDLKEGRTVVFADANKDSRTRTTAQALEAISALSVVNMPIVEGGRSVALLYLNHAVPREWPEDELEFVREVAERTRMVAERRRAEEALQLLNTTLEQRVTEEIAERLKAEEQLRQSQKMEAVGQLTGGIAHDFNNMLAVVISGLELVRRKLERGDTDYGRFIDGAMDGARRAATLTQRLLAFSRQQPLAPEPLNVNKLVGSMSELLGRTLGETISIETVLGAGLWQVKVDPTQLESAILNLSVNARDAMGRGGKLTIETSNASIDRSYARNYELSPGQFVLVAITDTGEGMHEDVVAKAFDPFFTTKGVGKGTGLGLSQVYGFVRQSGGNVKLYSEPGVGTTVKIYLPRYYGSMAAKEAARPAVVSRGVPLEVVMVVEDDERVRAVSVETLRDLGYTVIEASRPSEAIRVLESDERLDLVFSDVVMPEMSGRELAEVARKLRPGLKVLFTTGYTRNAIVHNGVLDSDTKLLSKPFSIEELAAKVREILDSE